MPERIASKARLYHLTPPDFYSPNYVDSEGGLKTLLADNIPIICWPDGRWCHAGNTFIRKQMEKGLSRRNRGGSLAIFAQHIGHLIRFCWRRRIDFIELNDNDFKDFVGSLEAKGKINFSTDRPRQPSQVIAIGRTCLSFLKSVADHAADRHFLGSDGRIKTVERRVRISTVNGPSRTVVQISHASFPNASPACRRGPISQASITAIREEASRTRDNHIRARRQAIITLLDATGARRGELSELTVRSVVEAAMTQPPMLSMTTLKRGSHQRLIPISPADLAFLRNYAIFHRAPLMRRLGAAHRDHGKLFVSSTDGSPLTPGALGAEISQLGRAAGVLDATCHRFRHRFITKLFVSLVRNHKTANPDQFRQLLISTEALKRKVMEWTGHKSLASLEFYIDLAFNEIVNLPVVYDWARVGIALDNFLSSISVWTDELPESDATGDKIKLFKDSVSALRDEVARAAAIGPEPT